MKRKIFIVLTFFYQNIFAQYYHLEGTVGSQKISMDVVKNQKSIKGTHFYYHIGEPLILTGKEEEGVWKLNESNLNNDETGNWELKWNGSVLTGTWYNKTQKFNVTLQENYNNSLRFKIVELSEEFKPSTKYGLKNYVGLFFPLPSINSGRNYNLLKTVCDTILSEINLKTKELNENAIKNEFQRSFNEIKNTYQNIVLKDQSICETAPLGCDWYNTQTGEPVFNQNQILCYKNSMYSYMGGAHGNYVSWHSNFNLLTGKIITLEDLFEDAENKLLPLMKTKLQQKYKTSNLDAVNLDEVFIPENFQITYGGIVFHYNPYEIGPYSLGSPAVFISYSELKNFLKKGHPITWIK